MSIIVHCTSIHFIAECCCKNITSKNFQLFQGTPYFCKHVHVLAVIVDDSIKNFVLILDYSPEYQMSYIRVVQPVQRSL